jgi:integrase/recombinase XerD
MNKGRKFPAEILKRGEIEQLLGATTNGDIGLRNRCAVFLLWRCGLRVSELTMLRPVDIGHDNLRVRFGKGCRPRTVGMDDETRAVVALWVAAREERGIGAGEPLICTLRGRGLRTNAMRDLLKRLALKAGVAKRVVPHAFRHTFAAVVGRQVHLVELQTALGHQSLATTERYLRSLGGTSVDAVRAVKW